MDIRESDYKKLIAYYGVPKTKEESLKELGEKILATQLCVCVSGKNLSPGKKLIEQLEKKSKNKMKRRYTSNNVTKKVSSPKRNGSSLSTAKKSARTKKKTSSIVL
jgi:hypothetical protein